MSVPQNFKLITRPFRKDLNNNFNLNANRNLFGPPDANDIQLLLKEQRDYDKERFLVNFGVDIDQLGYLDEENLMETYAPLGTARLRAIEAMHRRFGDFKSHAANLKDFDPLKGGCCVRRKEGPN